MKRLFALLAILALVASCTPKPQEEYVSTVQHPEWVKDAILYEVNMRQYSPESSFAEFEKHLPRLQELGIDILWFMPIHPIGVEGRKGELGSYYSVKDYYDVNPEYGTLDEFKALVNKAHDMGFKVIIDWVQNHTARDNQWTVDHPEWYLHEEDGTISFKYDWSDTAVLDYSNAELRQAMTDAMKFWLTEVGIDGFRCDVAGELPQDFWDECTRQLREVNPDIFMLAEAENPSIQENSFDAYYSWQMMHTLYDLSARKIQADSLVYFFIDYPQKTRMPLNTIPMNFTTNHDQNSWTGTDLELYGSEEAVKQFAAFTFAVPGMPMIYTGEEVSLDKRLEFFVKDPVDWEADKWNMTDFYKGLIAMRDAHPSLWAQPWGGEIFIIENDCIDRIVAFEREVEGDICLAMFNFSDQQTTFTLEQHTATKDNEFTLPAHGYRFIFNYGQVDCDCPADHVDEEGNIVEHQETADTAEAE